MKRLSPPNRERLMDRLYYDPITGLFIWLGGEFVGQFAGTLNQNGYIHIKFDGVDYKAHHLAWFIHYDLWPEMLDHEDKNKINNAILNLREANDVQNRTNRFVNRNNKLGVKGVCAHGNKFIAQITINRKRTYLGLYNTIEEASNAYITKAREIHGEFACR